MGVCGGGMYLLLIICVQREEGFVDVTAETQHEERIMEVHFTDLQLGALDEKVPKCKRRIGRGQTGRTNRSDYQTDATNPTTWQSVGSTAPTLPTPQLLPRRCKSRLGPD